MKIKRYSADLWPRFAFFGGFCTNTGFFLRSFNVSCSLRSPTLSLSFLFPFSVLISREIVDKKFLSFFDIFCCVQYRNSHALRDRTIPVHMPFMLTNLDNISPSKNQKHLYPMIGNACDNICWRTRYHVSTASILQKTIFTQGRFPSEIFRI